MDNESLIESYFEGNLTTQEKLLFDKLMQTDQHFAETVSFEEKTKVAITLEARENLKTILRSLENKIENKRSKTWLYIAASVIVLLGVSLFFMNQTPSNEKLFATYFEPYPNTVAPIVRNSSQKDLKSDAFAAYELGDYQRAAQLFNTLTENSQEDFAPFYHAISLMMLDEIDGATTIFKSNPWNIGYQEKVDWYLSLCHLKQGRIRKAKALLSNIVQSQSYNSEKAKYLLSKLN